MFSDLIKTSWGFHPMQDAFFETLKQDNPNLVPARVVFSSHEYFKVVILGTTEERASRVRGSFYFEGGTLPVVGDWVVVEFTPGDHAHLPIESILPRRSKLDRMDGQRGLETLVSNVDHIGLVTSFNQDFNVRRLERGLAMIEASGAKPIVILNKADLVSESEIFNVREELRERFGELNLVICSGAKKEGLKQIEDQIQLGETLTLIGMSGVGKSTLINGILEREALFTQEIREDDSRGKHTTTHRELFLIEKSPEKSFWLLDSPGIRSFSFGGEGEDLNEVFSEISVLIEKCKFSDCRHQSEPNCAIQAALGCGELDPDRWWNYLKVRAEARFHASKSNKALNSERKKEYVKRAKQLRKKLKDRWD